MSANIPIIPVMLGFSANKDEAVKELAYTLGVVQEKIEGKEFKYKIMGDKSQVEKILSEISKMGLKDFKIGFDTSGLDAFKNKIKKDGKTVGETFSDNINQAFNAEGIERKLKDIISNTTGKSVNSVDSMRALENTARGLREIIEDTDGLKQALQFSDMQGILKYVDAFENLGLVLKQIKNIEVDTNFKKASSLDKNFFNLSNIQNLFEHSFDNVDASNAMANITKQFEQAMSTTKTLVKNMFGDIFNDIKPDIDLSNLNSKLIGLKTTIKELQNEAENINLSDLKNNIGNLYQAYERVGSSKRIKELVEAVKEYIYYGGKFKDLSDDIQHIYNASQGEFRGKGIYQEPSKIETIADKIRVAQEEASKIQDQINIKSSTLTDNGVIVSQNKLQAELKETTNDLNTVTKNAKEAADAINQVGTQSALSPSSNINPTEKVDIVEDDNSPQEALELGLVEEAANKTKVAIDSKTASIVLEEQQMRQSASKEVQSLLAITEKVEILTQEIAKIAEIRLPEIKLGLSDKDENNSYNELLTSIEKISGLSSFLSSTFTNLQSIKDTFSSIDNIDKLSISKNTVTNFESLSKAIVQLKESLKDLPSSTNDFLKSISEISKQTEALKSLSSILKSTPKQVKKVKDELNKTTSSRDEFSAQPLEASLKTIGKYQKAISALEGDNSKTLELQKYNQLLEEEKLIYAELYKTASQNSNFDKDSYNQKVLSIQREIQAQLELIKTRQEEKKIKAQSKQDVSDQENLAAIDRQIQALKARAEAYKSVNSKLFSSVDPKAQDLVNEFDKFLNKLQLIESQSSDIKNGLTNAFGDKSIKETAYSARNLSGEFSTLTNKIKGAGFAAKSLPDLLKESFSNLGRYFFGAGMIQELQQGMRRIYENVENYDESVVNLQIASGKAKEEILSLMSSYNSMAKTLGATTKEMADSADTWLRQGYSLKETNELIEASLIQSKLGQLESAESTKYLTSALKGYKVEVEDALNVVDKMSAVDLEAAVSLGGLAEAMAETANSARIAGISMDKLLGYEAVIGEVTQDSMSSVGNSLKRIFSRMGNVKAGKFVDDEGEDISNVEKVLGKLGIKLRDTQDEFRNFGEVLDEIAGNWDTFTSVEQRAIVTALAGATQAEKLLVLLENYGDAIKYTETAMNASGTAMEKFNAYQDGVEAKTKRLQASFEGLSNTFLNGDFVKGSLDFLSSIISGLDTLINKLGTVGTLATLGGGVLGAKGLGLT